MRIGIVQLGNVSEDTGGRNYLVNFAKALSRLETEHRFTFFLSPNQKTLIEPFLSETLAVVEVPPASKSSVAKVVAEQLVAPFYLAKHGIEVAYFPGNFVSLLSPAPTVVAIRSMLYYHYPYAVDKARLLVRKVLTPPSARTARAIITPSADIKKDVANFIGVGERKIHVVHHGVDIETFQKNYVEAEREAVLKKFGITKKFILYASALWEYKNQDKLILALKNLLERYGHDLQLALAGKGLGPTARYEARLRQLVAETGLNERVIFAGLVPHQELKYLYKSAEVFAYPSGYESFGNPLFEAWAAGTPVVCANVHSFPEMTENGACAVMVNPADVEALAAALHRVLTDSALRLRLIEAGRARVASFSWEKCVRETLAVIEGALARKAHR
ncbi:MAG: glycosyltransferase family 4 protein [Chloroherpetonaceae bacterium]|nr:glycosyltransferase family 4 protein [Chloroherpetonaceae bacterium]MDW8438418.1 glycosyltransferase family 1 protein [Chloroherpetonaceae bacterium]